MVNETERNFLLVMAYCGLRPWAELLPLTPNYFDGEQIHVTHTKTGKSRFVPVPDEIAEILNSSLPWKTSYSQVRDQWEQARIQVGHPEWWIYDLRHTFASWLAPSVPLTVIRDLLGHTTTQTTNRYVHLQTEAHREAISHLPPIHKNIA